MDSLKLLNENYLRMKPIQKTSRMTGKFSKN